MNANENLKKRVDAFIGTAINPYLGVVAPTKYAYEFTTPQEVEQFINDHRTKLDTKILCDSENQEEELRIYLLNTQTDLEMFFFENEYGAGIRAIDWQEGTIVTVTDYRIETFVNDLMSHFQELS